MFCEHCGKKVDETWKFCKGCGQKMVHESHGECDDRRPDVLDDLSQNLEETSIKDCHGECDGRRPNVLEDLSQNLEETSIKDCHGVCDGRRPNVVEDLPQNLEETSIEDCIGPFELEEDYISDETNDEDKSTMSVHVIDKLDENFHLRKADGTIDLADEKEVQFVLDYQRLYGIPKLMKKLLNRLNKWKKVKINIALTGVSGCGKSTLINTLRGLKSDDEGAAKAGCDETTTEPACYLHPNNSNLVYWDLPGVGTKQFPKDSYLEKVKFNLYDAFILVSNSRYTELDSWLANEINDRYPDAALMFVRTKIDNDVLNEGTSRRKPMTVKEQDDMVTKMKETSQKMLLDDGIRNPQVFMINSTNENEFDFGRFVNELTMKVSEVKQEAFVLSETILTKYIVRAKIRVLKERMKVVSLTAAVAAVNSNRHKNELKEIAVLQQEFKMYQKQLGIDTNSVWRVSRLFKCDVTAVLKFKSVNCLNNFEQFYKQHDKIVPSMWYSLPFFGKYLQLRAYQSQCICVLQTILNYCVNDNKAMREYIRSELNV